jgi:hypothetical protein
MIIEVQSNARIIIIILGGFVMTTPPITLPQNPLFVTGGNLPIRAGLRVSFFGRLVA